MNDGLAEKEEQMPESDVEELDLELFWWLYTYFYSESVASKVKYSYPTYALRLHHPANTFFPGQVVFLVEGMGVHSFPLVNIFPYIFIVDNEVCFLVLETTHFREGGSIVDHDSKKYVQDDGIGVIIWEGKASCDQEYPGSYHHCYWLDHSLNKSHIWADLFFVIHTYGECVHVHFQVEKQ